MKPYFYSLNPDSIKESELDLLLSLGWYRMHQHVFACSHLHLEVPHRVHWLRYPLAEINAHTSHKRIRKHCQAFRHTIEVFNAIPDAHELLYANYRQSINFDGADSVHQCLYGEVEAGENILKPDAFLFLRGKG